jgi:hypothetical protein
MPMNTSNYVQRIYLISSQLLLVVTNGTTARTLTYGM